MAKQVAKRVEATVVTARMKQALATQFPELPETLDGKIDPYAWLKAMVLNAEYTEPDPDYIAREMLMNVLLTEDDTEALVGAGMDGLQDVLEDFAGNTCTWPGPTRTRATGPTSSSRGGLTRTARSTGPPPARPRSSGRSCDTWLRASGRSSARSCGTRPPTRAGST